MKRKGPKKPKPAAAAATEPRGMRLGLELGRREFIGAVAGAAALFGLGGAAGCGDDDPDPEPSAYDKPPTTAPTGKELRGLHFSLRHSKVDDEHFIKLWGKKYKLERHDAASLANFAGDSALLAAYADARPPTHYVPPVPFPKAALQSYGVYRTSAKHKLPQFVIGGIHVPKSELAAHHARAAAGDEPLMLGHRIAATGLKQSAMPTYEDFEALANIGDVSAAATYVCFHYPELATVDPTVATKVLGYIESSGGMNDLEVAIGSLGAATDPDESGEYEGWANGFYLLGPDDEPILTTSGEPMWEVRVDDAVNAAASPVVREALNLVRNDPDLLNVRYAIQSGTHAVDVSGATKGGMPSTSCTGARVNAFPDQGEWRGGAKVELDSSDADGNISFTVHNDYFLYRGVYVAFRDAAGTLLKLSDINGGTLKIDGTDVAIASRDFENFKYMGILADRFRILGIPLNSESSSSWSIAIPAEATQLEVYAGTLAYSYHGDSSLLSSDPYDQLKHSGALTTGLMDLFLPTLGLAAGIGGAVLAQLKSELEILPGFIAFMVTASVGTGVLASMQGNAGRFAVTKILWWFTTVAGKVAAAAFKEELAEFLASIKSSSVWEWIMSKFSEAAAESEAEEEVPIAGQILYAVNIIGSLAEITETMVDLALTSPVQVWKTSRVHDIKLTIQHDINNTQFPAEATKMIVTALFSGSVAQTYTRELTGTELLVSTMEVDFCGVPEGGSVNFTVQYLSTTNWIAGQSTLSSANLTPSGQTFLALTTRIEERLVPLSADTTYSSSFKLGYQSGVRTWIDDTVSPVRTLMNASCASAGAALCAPTSLTVSSRYGQVGYTWQAAGPGVAGCMGQGAAGVQLYLAQNLNFSGDINSGAPESLLMEQSCGVNRASFLGYELKGGADGNHFFVDPSTGKNHLRKISLVNGGSFSASSYGTFVSPALRGIALHSAAYAAALSEDGNKIEILPLADAPFPNDAAAEVYLATQAAGPGRNFGNLLGGVAIAATPTGSSFLVLEHTNQRIQCFSRYGQPVMDYFVDTSATSGRSSVAALRVPTGGATYLDMSVEGTGYIYVLGYVGTGALAADYFMDIYQPTGAWLVTTPAFAAAKIAVDLWRTVFSLDWDAYQTSDLRTEPVIRRWIPSTPMG